jgi:hypothetical protein
MDLEPMNGNIPKTHKKKEGNELDKRGRNLAKKKVTWTKNKEVT